MERRKLKDSEEKEVLAKPTLTGRQSPSFKLSFSSAPPLTYWDQTKMTQKMTSFTITQQEPLNKCPAKFSFRTAFFSLF
uniref:Uncharacterized protein n=1 Tax=Anguilla anguilla TaxID=7936 RepID=A0A0E9VX76_ANGAN